MVQVRVLCAPKFGALMRDTLRPDAQRSSPVAPTARVRLMCSALCGLCSACAACARHRAVALGCVRVQARSVSFRSGCAGYLSARIACQPHVASSLHRSILSSVPMLRSVSQPYRHGQAVLCLCSGVALDSTEFPAIDRPGLDTFAAALACLNVSILG